MHRGKRSGVEFASTATSQQLGMPRQREICSGERCKKSRGMLTGLSMVVLISPQLLRNSSTTTANRKQRRPCILSHFGLRMFRFLFRCGWFFFFLVEKLAFVKCANSMLRQIPRRDLAPKDTVDESRTGSFLHEVSWRAGTDDGPGPKPLTDR